VHEPWRWRGRSAPASVGACQRWKTAFLPQRVDGPASSEPRFPCSPCFELAFAFVGELLRQAIGATSELYPQKYSMLILALT